MGRVSGLGWGLGYLGGITILLVIIALMGTGFDADQVRLSMILCGIWTIVFTIPIFRSLKDKPPTHPGESLGIVGSYKALFASIKRLWRVSPNTLYFLIAAALFRDGLAGVFAFGGVLAEGSFDFEFGEVVIFGVVANVVAGVATILFGLVDDKIGPKKVIVFSLVCLVLLGLGIFFLHEGGKPVFWALGLALTIFVGPAQSASRSLLARLIPEGMSGEMFGLYATTGRAVSFLSPLMFGLAIALGVAVVGGTEDSAQYWGILGVVVVLFIGLIFAIFVKEPPKTHLPPEDEFAAARMG